MVIWYYAFSISVLHYIIFLIIVSCNMANDNIKAKKLLFRHKTTRNLLKEEQTKILNYDYI